MMQGAHPARGLAVEQAENVRDLLGQSWRHKQAAQKLVRTGLQGWPDVPG
jgi:hypothetical protein